MPPRRTATVLTALVLTAALPMPQPSSREYATSAVVVLMDTKDSGRAEATAAFPVATFSDATADGDEAVAQTAAMLLVGTLLIGIGSLVRRVV